MKVGFYQFDVKTLDKAFNLEKVAQKLDNVRFDLVVLPELFTSGYLLEPGIDLKPIAEKIPNGPTTEFMEALSEKNNAYLVGSIIEFDKGLYFNTAIITGPNGYIGKQRKIHITNFEKNLFYPGNSIEVFDTGSFKMGVMICFDI